MAIPIITPFKKEITTMFKLFNFTRPLIIVQNMTINIKLFESISLFSRQGNNYQDCVFGKPDARIQTSNDELTKQEQEIKTDNKPIESAINEEK
jgi:hypothetical protein